MLSESRGTETALSASLLSYDAMVYYKRNPELRRVMDQITSGFFNPKNPDLFKDVTDMLFKYDRYVGSCEAHLHLFLLEYPLSKVPPLPAQ